MNVTLYERKQTFPPEDQYLADRLHLYRHFPQGQILATRENNCFGFEKWTDTDFSLLVNRYD